MLDPKFLFSLLSFLATVVPCHAAADTAPPTPVEIVKIATADEVVQADGSYMGILHAEVLATNQSAAQKIAQHTIEYSESMETAEVLEAFTRKADGRVLEVDQTQIFPQAPRGWAQVPMFSDRKQKVIVFPDVSAEDTVVWTIKRTHKPFFAGQFFTGAVYQRGFGFEDVRRKITLPKETAAHVEARGVDHQVEEAGQTVTHTFRYSNPRPPVAVPAAVSPWDADPQYTLSTFPDYAAIASAYRQISIGKAAVTPRIQAIADEITAGVADRREQAHRIYDWVSTHIRYVAIVLGNGGYVPHDAAGILENGYGDCKDHVVLLSACSRSRASSACPC
jgi:hypothetical protein